VEKQQKKIDVMCWNEKGTVEIKTGIIFWRLKPFTRRENVCKVKVKVTL
jgi:hypothetical protein